MVAHRLLDDLYAVDYTRADPGASGTLRIVGKSFVHFPITTAAAEARTLPVPTKAGLVVAVSLRVHGGDLTLTVTSGFEQAGTTDLVFDDAGDCVVLMSFETAAATYRWRILTTDGVTGPVGQEIITVAGIISSGIISVDDTTDSTSGTTGSIHTDGGLGVVLDFFFGAGIVGAGSNRGLATPLAAQQTLAAGGGAVTITEYYTAGASDVGGDAWTLADGAAEGQLKKIQLVTDGGGDATLTPTTLNGGTTIVFADVGDYAILVWDSAGWTALELGNHADGATAPVLS